MSRKASRAWEWTWLHPARGRSARELLDHHFLDEVQGLGIPTLENLCALIWKALEPKVPGLSAVMVERHAIGDKCIYRPE